MTSGGAETLSVGRTPSLAAATRQPGASQATTGWSAGGEGEERTADMKLQRREAQESIGPAQPATAAVCHGRSHGARP